MPVQKRGILEIRRAFASSFFSLGAERIPCRWGNCFCPRLNNRIPDCNRSNFPGIVSGLEGLFRLSNVRLLRCCALPDEVGKPRHVGSTGNSKSVPQVVPEWQAKLLAGFLPSGIGIACGPPCLASGPERDLAPDDIFPDVVFNPVCVERCLRMVENAQQLVLVRLQPFEHPVEAGITGTHAEDPVEPCLHDLLAQRGGAFPAAARLR